MKGVTQHGWNIEWRISAQGYGQRAYGRGLRKIVLEVWARTKTFWEVRDSSGSNGNTFNHTNNIFVTRGKETQAPN
jgi:hypothetical protein